MIAKRKKRLYKDKEKMDAREDKNHWKEEKNKPKIERYKIKIPMMKDERIPKTTYDITLDSWKQERYHHELILFLLLGFFSLHTITLFS